MQKNERRTGPVLLCATVKWANNNKRSWLNKKKKKKSTTAIVQQKHTTRKERKRSLNDVEKFYYTVPVPPHIQNALLLDSGLPVVHLLYDRFVAFVLASVVEFRVVVVKCSVRQDMRKSMT